MRTAFTLRYGLQLRYGMDIVSLLYALEVHHRYFEVNYGMLLLPMDKWFGTFHDGSMEAHEEMKSRRRASAEAGDTENVIEGTSKRYACTTSVERRRIGSG